MKKLLAVLMLMATLGAYGQPVQRNWATTNSNPVVSQANGGLGNAGTFATNLTTNFLQAWVSGSTAANVNGQYVQQWTNASTGEAVWTNVSSTANHLHLNDPGVNIGGIKWVIEAITNDPNFLYYNPDDNPATAYPFSDWGVNTGPGTDILGFLWGTNFTVSSTAMSVLSNAFTLQRTNFPVITVNSLTGNDALAIGSAGFKYQNLSNACFDPRIGNGGVINVEPGFYPETNFMLPPTNVTINAYGAVFTGYGGISDSQLPDGFAQVILNSSDTLNGFTTTNAVLEATAGCSNAVLNNCNFQGRIDGFFGPIDSMDCFNSKFGSFWDSMTLGASHTNCRVRLFNCKLESVYHSGTLANEVRGLRLTGYNGKVEIYGGEIIAMGATNLTGTNACITVETSSSTASLELYGTVLKHGTTNANVNVYAIAYNNGISAIPISGWYIDMPCTDPNAITNIGTPVFLNEPIIGSSTNTPSGTLILTNFIDGKIYTNIYGRNIGVEATVNGLVVNTQGVNYWIQATGYLTNPISFGSDTTGGWLYTNQIHMWIPPNQTYVFTNKSSGGATANLSGGQIMVY